MPITTKEKNPDVSSLVTKPHTDDFPPEIKRRERFLSIYINEKIIGICRSVWRPHWSPVLTSHGFLQSISEQRRPSDVFNDDTNKRKYWNLGQKDEGDFSFKFNKGGSLSNFRIFLPHIVIRWYLCYSRGARSNNDTALSFVSNMQQVGIPRLFFKWGNKQK